MADKWIHVPANEYRILNHRRIREKFFAKSDLLTTIYKAAAVSESPDAKTAFKLLAEHIESVH